MIRSQRALVVGSALAVVYVGLAVVSGSLSSFASRPLLDGFAPPPPYRWVRPPPSQAAGNQPPRSGTFTVSLNPGSGSEAGVFSPNDQQVSLVLEPGAIAARAGQDSVRLSIQPLDPAKFPAPPAGLAVAGNVYRVAATYQPDGGPVGDLRHPGQIALAYPPLTSLAVTGHVLLTSPDGKRWQRVPSASDSTLNLQISANTSGLGYFAVAGAPTAPTQRSSGSSLLRRATFGLVILLAVLVVFLLVRFEVEQRRRARRARGMAGRGSRGSPRG